MIARNDRVSGGSGKDKNMKEIHEHSHPHPHSHSHPHDHSHLHPCEHSHTHDPEEIRSVVNRLSRCIGHLEKVKQMVEAGEDCSDVLIQLAAVRSALNNAGKLLLKGHLEHCIVDAIEEEDDVAIEKMKTAIDRFIS